MASASHAARTAYAKGRAGNRGALRRVALRGLSLRRLRPPSATERRPRSDSGGIEPTRLSLDRAALRGAPSVPVATSLSTHSPAMQKPLLPIAALVAGLTLADAAAAQGIGTELAATGFNEPLYVTAPRGDARLFVLEQNQSDIEIWENGAKLATPFLDLTGLTSTGGERGLLGLAFHPDYDQNGHFFVDYTRAGDGATVVARFTVTSDPNVADPASLVQLLVIPQPFSNHNGGCLQFGPDGYLYISTGDGGAANDPDCNAQNPNSLLGKLLRIDVDAVDTTGTYGIPADNPFVGNPGVLDEIFHTGLRNPWRFSFDRGTGDIYIGDVGQDAREEVSFAALGAAGLDFGWRILEGTLCNGFGACPMSLVEGCGDPIYTPPILENAHAGVFGGPCSITGGYVYRGNDIPSLQGTYFWTDVCDPDIFSFEFDGTTVTNQVNRTAELDPPGAATITSVVSFGEDGFGELYIVEQGGDIWKIVPDAGPAPTPELTGDWGGLSIVSGGTQRMTLDSDPSLGGSLYFLAGTTSGTTPGLPFGGVTVPLNVDAYTNFTLANPNSAPLTASLGSLDATGGAQARFDLPGGLASPTLAGTTLHHAYVTLDGVGSVTSASNALALTLAP